MTVESPVPPHPPREERVDLRASFARLDPRKRGEVRKSLPHRKRGTNPRLKSSNFPHIEITGLLAPNVSSQAPRRNNSLLHETIFLLWCRHPETEPN